MPKETIKIVIGGDICPIGKNLPYFIRGEVSSIFNDLLPIFMEADLSIVNLECPLVDKESPIEKVGPGLRVPSDCVNGLKQAKIDVVNLANNHIMDHGANGLFSTLKSCKEAGVSTIGAGGNIIEAREILIKEINGIKIGVIGLAEREFSIATKSSSGANPLDLIDYVRNINSKKGNFDHLIVLIHGGNEHYPFPSPRLKKVCRFFVEMGANTVIVQHTHCSGCYEEYNKSFIVYGQGNLIFDFTGHNRSFYEGFLVELSISEDLNSTVNLIPFSQSCSHVGARQLKNQRSVEFLEEIKKRSLAIKDDTFLKNQWLKFCERKKSAYLNRVYGLNLVLTKLIYRNLFVRLFLNRISLYQLQNTISCESHREVLETLLENRMI